MYVMEGKCYLQSSSVAGDTRGCAHIGDKMEPVWQPSWQVASTASDMLCTSSSGNTADVMARLAVEGTRAREGSQGTNQGEGGVGVTT